MSKKSKEKVMEEKWIEKKREKDEKRKEKGKEKEDEKKIVPKKEREEKTKERGVEKPKEKIKESEKKKLKKIEKIKFRVVGEKEVQVEVKKKKKPKFLRQEFGTRKKLGKKWRRPRGIDSKKHEEKRGKGKVPRVGYKNPGAVRGLIKGFKSKTIYNPLQLSSIINPREEAIIISGKVGRKKRNEIIKEANKLKLTILNPRKGEI